MGGVDGAIAGRAARVLAMECLLIPSEELVGVAQPDESHGHLKFEWHPGSTARSQLNDYRHELNDLSDRVSSLLS
jgi:hypothetical protein